MIAALPRLGYAVCAACLAAAHAIPDRIERLPSAILITATGAERGGYGRGAMTGEARLTVRMIGAVSTRSTPGRAPTLAVRNSYSDSWSRQTAQAARLAGRSWR